MNNRHKRPFRWLGTTGLLLLIILVACSQQPETVTVEVTRVVTETFVEEGETVEVTRVVTETIIETVEVEAESPDGDPPAATGSEGDAEPLPPPPNDGPKVAESRGSTNVAELAVETAVALRANQTNSANNSTTQTTIPIFNLTELQKWCELIAKSYKKRCG